MKTVYLIKLILIIFGAGIIGGAIAFLGNQLGRYIGRRKLSIFKLRPRYTSILFTVATGMLIVILTLTVAVVVSEPVRIALSDYEELKKETDELIKRLDEARRLDQQTDVVYGYQDIIISAVLKADPDEEKMRDALKTLIAETNQMAIAKSRKIARQNGKTFTPPDNNRLVGYLPENLDEVAEKLKRATGKYVLFVRANHTALLGNIITVEISNPIKNQLIFRKGDFITETVIDGSKSRPSVENQLMKCISQNIPVIAIRRGILPNPETREVGEIDPECLINAIDSITGLHGKALVKFYARNDTYILGPLSIEIKLEPYGE